MTVIGVIALLVMAALIGYWVAGFINLIIEAWRKQK